MVPGMVIDVSAVEEKHVVPIYFKFFGKINEFSIEQFVNVLSKIDVINVFYKLILVNLIQPLNASFPIYVNELGKLI